MPQLRANAALLLIAVAIAATASDAAAGPLTLTPEKYQELLGSMASGGISAGRKNAPDAARKDRGQPVPQMTFLPATEANFDGAASSMTSTAPSPVPAGIGAPLPSACQPALLCLAGEWLAPSDGTIVPPHFLDGIFRPPRSVSL
jgi:hypothetical protein